MFLVSFTLVLGSAALLILGLARDSATLIWASIAASILAAVMLVVLVSGRRRKAARHRSGKRLPASGRMTDPGSLPAAAVPALGEPAVWIRGSGARRPEGSESVPASAFSGAKPSGAELSDEDLRAQVAALEAELARDDAEEVGPDARPIRGDLRDSPVFDDLVADLAAFEREQDDQETIGGRPGPDESDSLADWLVRPIPGVLGRPEIFGADRGAGTPDDRDQRVEFPAAGAHIAPEPDHEANLASEPEPNAEPEAVLEPVPQAEAEPELARDAELAQEAELEPESEPAPEPEAEPSRAMESLTGPQIEPEPEIEPAAEPEPVRPESAEPEPVVPEAETAPEPRSEPEPESETEPQPAAEPDWLATAALGAGVPAALPVSDSLLELHTEPLPAAAAGLADEPVPVGAEAERPELHTPAALSADDPEPAQESFDPDDADILSEMDEEVFVIDGRPRYHLYSCLFLSGRDGLPIALGEAKQDGFSPCGVCTPDAVTAGAVRRRLERTAARTPAGISAPWMG